MRLYLSGPMRGIPHWNFDAFDEARDTLEARGHYVVSPADHDREVDPDCVRLPEYETGAEVDGETFHKLIGWDLMILADPGAARLDALVLLPGWEKSVGVGHELYVARATGKLVYEYLPSWDGHWLSKLPEDEQALRQANKMFDAEPHSADAPFETPARWEPALVPSEEIFAAWGRAGLLLGQPSIQFGGAEALAVEAQHATRPGRRAMAAHAGPMSEMEAAAEWIVGEEDDVAESLHEYVRTTGHAFSDALAAEQEARKRIEQEHEDHLGFITKDSGKREAYASGMVRDTQDGKPRFDLIPLLPLTRLADLYTRGAVKYGDRNWQKADSDEELQRFKGSAFRHLVQWLQGDTDEDHAIAVAWNVFAWVWLEDKMGNA